MIFLPKNFMQMNINSFFYKNIDIYLKLVKVQNSVYSLIIADDDG